MSEAEMVPVTQAARDAAAAFYGPHLARPGEVLVTAHMRAGKIDESPLIQAFARAMLAAEAAAIERCAQVADSVRDAALPSHGYDEACDDIATAIRSLKEGASHVG